MLTTPLNTELLPKKMDLNFIFKIRIFSKIRCGENKAITNQIQESALLPENKQKHKTMTEEKVN